jgi:hypothetical protein
MLDAVLTADRSKSTSIETGRRIGNVGQRDRAHVVRNGQAAYVPEADG